VPSDEIWVKLGGDKGGGSVKIGFELANVANPNSIKNTVVFSMFEAPDSIHNLEMALKQYQDDVNSLQHETWR
jgi:hypothetical protein